MLHVFVLVLSIVVGLLLIVGATLTVRWRARAILCSAGLLFSGLVCLKVAASVIDLMQGGN